MKEVRNIEIEEAEEIPPPTAWRIRNMISDPVLHDMLAQMESRKREQPARQSD